MTTYVICALYHFAKLENYAELRAPLLKLMEQNNVRGTLLLASEGINGTIAGSRSGIDKVLAHLNNDPRLSPIKTKESFSEEMPFLRTKVKLKKEIVTMGVEGIDPTHIAGTYVKPKDWNQLISDPSVLVIDTRNDYEVQIGAFQNAVDPKTQNFREFPDYVKENLDPKQHKKVAMYCTGGIRCEKSTAYLKENGFQEVYHLEGGILKYLEEVPQSESLWQGECFVFDERVSVDHDLNPGSFDQCYACRMPITQAQKESKHYVKGISCDYCFENHTPEQVERFAQRQKQMQLAKERGEKHIGAKLAS